MRRCGLHVRVVSKTARMWFAFFTKIADVRETDVDSVHFVIRKSNAAVNDYHILTIFIYGQVFPDSFKPPNGMIFCFLPCCNGTLLFVW